MFGGGVETQVFPSPSLYAAHAAWLRAMYNLDLLTIELTFFPAQSQFRTRHFTLNSRNLCIKVKCEVVNSCANLLLRTTPEKHGHFRQVLWAKGSRLRKCPTRGTLIRSSSGLSIAFPLNCPRGSWKFKFIWQRTLQGSESWRGVRTGLTSSNLTSDG